MGPAILIQMLVGAAALQMALMPAPAETRPEPKQEILSAVVSESEASPATPTPTPSHKTYTTKAGDTLATIARSEYGSQKYWVHIWNDNEDLKDPAVIHAGTKLTIRTSNPTEVEESTRDLPTPSPTVTPTEAPSVEIATATVTPAPAQNVGAPGSFSQAYIDAGNKFGIPWQVLYGIHKVETGLRDGPIDSGAGPQGPMQFMPGTWAVHGVDGNGDGVADINNAVDAIHSAANYLSKYGSIEQGLDSYGRIREDVLNIARELGYSS